MDINNARINGFVVNGELASIVEVVRASTFLLPTNYHGSFSLQLSLESPDGRRVESQTTITVFPVNHAPSIEVLTTAIPDFGKSPLSSVFSASDEDVTFLELSNDTLYRSYPAFCCFLRLNVTCNNCLLQYTQFTDSVVLVGTPNDLMDMLSEISVLLRVTESSPNSSLLVSLDDLQSYGAGEAITVVKNITLVSAPTALVPYIDAPSVLVIPSLAEARLSELAQGLLRIVNLPDAASYRLEVVSREGGRLVVDPPPGRPIVNTSSILFLMGTVSELNFVLNSLFYTAPDTMSDAIDITLFNGNQSLVDASISVVVTPVMESLIFNLSSTFLAVAEGSIVGLGDFLGGDAMPWPSSPINGGYTTTMEAFRQSTLEVQKVTIQPASTKVVQLISATAPPNQTIASGNVTLSLSLSAFGLGVLYSGPLFVDPYPIHWMEIGGDLMPLYPSTERLDLAFDSFLTPLEALGVTMAVTRSLTAGYAEWQITIQNAPVDFPLLDIASCQVVSSSGQLCTCAVSRGTVPDQEGLFVLELGLESTGPVPYSASSEAVASALESLLSVDAVSVVRQESLVGEISWLVTFFSLHDSAANTVSQLSIVPLPSGPSAATHAYPPMPFPQLNVETIQDGSGISRLYQIDTYSLQVDAVYELSAVFPQSVEGSFALFVQWEGAGFSVGPIFGGTVAAAADEVIGPYPPFAQEDGTKSGQSLQSLLRTLPFLNAIATDVEVERVSSGGKVLWSITFVQSSFIDLTILPINISHGVQAVVRQLQSPNQVDGTTFAISYGGYRTPTLNWNVSAADLEVALMSLPSVRNPEYGIGAVSVGRRGPNSQGGFRWYVAFTEDPDLYSPQELLVSMVHSVGVNTNMYAALLRDSVSMADAGVVLRVGGTISGSVENLGVASLFSPGPMMSFRCDRSSDVLAVLESSVLVPPQRWDGGLRLLFLVRAGGMSAVARQAQVRYQGVMHPPALFFNGSLLTSITLSVYEDVETVLGGLHLVDCNSGGGNISVTLEARRGSLRVGDGQSSPKLDLPGNTAILNILLPNVSFLTCAYCNGQDLISIIVFDGIEAVESTIVVAIIPVNNPPLIALANTSTYATLYDNESSWVTGHFHISANEAIGLHSLISVSDPDFNASNLFYGDITRPYIDSANTLAFASNLVHFSVSAQNGVFRMSGISSAALVVEGDLILGSQTAALLGSIADIQAALLSLTYAPRLDWAGVDLLVVSLDDRGNIGVGGSLVNTRRILLSVETVAFPPTITTPTQDVLTTYEDTTGVIGRAMSTDASLIIMADVSFEIGDRNVPLEAIEERIITAVDTRQHALYGDLVSNFTYANASVATAEAFMYVPLDYVTTNTTYTIRLQVYHGRLSLVDVPLDLEFTLGSGFLDDTIVFAGSLLDVNKALESIRYTPDINWNSLLTAADALLASHASEHIDVNVTKTGGLSDFVSVPILVRAVNDAPVLNLGYHSVENSLLATGDQVSRQRTAVKPLECVKNIACAILDIRVRDVDIDESSSGSVELSMRCSNGSFLIDPSSNNAYPSLQRLLGSHLQLLDVVIPSYGIPIILEGLYYLPNPNFIGADAIEISVNDLGNTGTCFSGPSCDLSDSLVLPVLIADLDSAPSITVPSAIVSAREGASVKIQGVSIVSNRLDLLISTRRVMVAGTDNWDPPAFIGKVESGNPYLVRISTSAGTVSLPLASQVEFLAGTGVNDAVVEFRAPLEMAVVALGLIVYAPSFADPWAQETISSLTISVQDLLSGLFAQDKTIEVNVVPTSILPNVNVMGERYNQVPSGLPVLTDIVPLILQEDSSLSLAPVYISTTDSTDAVFLLSVSALHGAFVSSDTSTSRILQIQPTGHVNVYGDLEYLNSLLSMTSYLPTANYNGQDTITVKCCSSPYNSGKACDARDVPLIVEPVNDSPQWDLSSPVAEVSQDSVISLAAYVSVQDVDSAHLFVLVSASAGSVFFTAEPEGVTVIEGLPEPGPTMKFYAATDSIPAAIGGLFYSPPMGWNSQDQQAVITLDLYAEDLASPSLTAAATLPVVVTKTQPRNPFFRLPGATYRTAPCDSQAIIQEDRAYPVGLLCDSIIAVVPYPITLRSPTLLANISLYFTDTLLLHPDVFQLRVYAAEGRLSFLAARSLGLRVLQDSSGGQFVSGTINQLNLVLSDLEYFSNSSLSMADSISLGVRSAASSSPYSWTNVTLPIVLTLPELSPLVRLTQSQIAVLEDHALSLGDTSLIVVDQLGVQVDYVGYELLRGSMVRVEAASNHGYLLLSLRGLNVSFLTSNYSSETQELYQTTYLQFARPSVSPYEWFSSFAIEGSLEQVSQALSTMLYRPSLNWNSQLSAAVEFDIITFTSGFVHSADGSLSNQSISTLSVMVFAVNDNPVIQTPYDIDSGTQWTGDLLSHTTLSTEPILSAMNEAVTIVGLSVRDVDLDSQGIVRVSLSSTNGAVSVQSSVTVPSLSSPLRSLGLVFFRGTGTNDTLMEFSGSVDAVNTALSLITFVPTPDFYGFGASVTVIVDDLGGFGLGGSMIDTRALYIIVRQRNVPPYIVLPPSSGTPLFIVDEGSQISISGVIPPSASVGSSSNAIGYELFAYYEPSAYSGALGPGMLDANRITYADILPGNLSSHPTFFMLFEDRLFFQADDGAHGPELWILDVSSPENPTVPKEQSSLAPSMFMDLLPGSVGSYPSYLIQHNGSMFFSSSGKICRFIAVPG